MGLKQEIEDLRAALGGKHGEEGLKADIAEAVATGAEAVEDAAEATRDAAGDAKRDARRAAGQGTSYDDLRETLAAGLADAGAKIEEFPAKYPMVTALAALGFGVALGMTLGRKTR